MWVWVLKLPNPNKYGWDCCPESCLTTSGVLPLFLRCWLFFRSSIDRIDRLLTAHHRGMISSLSLCLTNLVHSYLATVEIIQLLFLKISCEACDTHTHMFLLSQAILRTAATWALELEVLRKPGFYLCRVCLENSFLLWLINRRDHINTGKRPRRAV